MFSCEFYEIFINRLLIEHLRATVFGNGGGIETNIILQSKAL